MESDDHETSVWPPHRHAFEQLEERLGYGEQFTWHEVCDLLEINPAKRDSWVFLQEWLGLKHAIENEGFLVTERGMNGKGFRLLLREEMAARVRASENRKADDSIRKSFVLSQVPRDDLAPEDAAALDHWENKAAILGAAGKTLIRKRKVPPIEMMIKSIKALSG